MYYHFIKTVSIIQLPFIQIMKCSKITIDHQNMDKNINPGSSRYRKLNRNIMDKISPKKDIPCALPCLQKLLEFLFSLTWSVHARSVVQA